MPSLTIDEIQQFSQFSTDIFIETGTFVGDTINNVKNHFKQVYSIELSNKYAASARDRFKDNRNVYILQGDSSELLLPLCQSIEQPVFFWLDGHWSNGDTAKGKKDCPLMEELDKIVTYCKVKCIIAIDDVRIFGTNNNEDWSDITRESILNKVQNRLESCKYYPSPLYTEDRMVLTLTNL
jgi:hypothetical protein